VSKSLADEVLADKNTGLSEMTYIALAYEASGDKNSAEDIQKQLRRFILPGTREVDITDPAGYYRNWYFRSNKSEDLALLLMLYSKLSVNDALCVRLLTTLLQEQKRITATGTTHRLRRMCLRALPRGLPQKTSHRLITPQKPQSAN
jgi:hypothetical protein